MHDIVNLVDVVDLSDFVRGITERRRQLREFLHLAIPRIGPQPEDSCATALGLASVRF